MKKIFTYALVMMMSMMSMTTLTSCNTEDEIIADYLTTGDWEGYLGAYVTNRWGEAFSDGQYMTVWHFDAEGYSNGRAVWGYGEEVDYNRYSRRDAAYSTFRWEVRNGNIYIEYDASGWAPVRIDYYDYKISRSRFSGVMYDWADRIYEFDLTNTYFNWSPYANGYWARTRGADGTDAEGVPVVVLDDGKCVLRGKFAEEYLKNTSFACMRR
jgi:hypothetical protein